MERAGGNYVILRRAIHFPGPARSRMTSLLRVVIRGTCLTRLTNHSANHSAIHHIILVNWNDWRWILFSSIQLESTKCTCKGQRCRQIIETPKPAKKKCVYVLIEVVVVFLVYVLNVLNVAVRLPTGNVLIAQHQQPNWVVDFYIRIALRTLVCCSCLLPLRPARRLQQEPQRQSLF
jgi:hypothetical protein